MIQGYRGLILSAMAAACLASPAYATVAQKKPVHHHPVAHRHVVARRAPVSTPLSDDAFLHGSVPDVGSDDRYYSDTRSPPSSSFGPSIFSRWQ